MFKDKPDEIRWFKNGSRYSIMMQARSDTLKLGWRGFEDDKIITCKLCKRNKIETLEHFVLDCHELQIIRNKILFLQLPRPQETAELLHKVLFFLEKDIPANVIIDTILQMWIVRLKHLKV